MVRAKIILSTFMTAAIAATALSGCAEQTESTAETTVSETRPLLSNRDFLLRGSGR